MDQGLNGKRVLVTGGTRGIGKATTLAFARAGARVITCHHSTVEAAETLGDGLTAETLGEGLTAETLGESRAEPGQTHQVVRADVTCGADVTRLVDTCAQRLGDLDVLVNNVGVDSQVMFAELTEQEWHRVVQHNVTAAYLVTRAALPVLADGASVVNIGSSVALRGRIGGVHYTASKAALIGFTRALCKELGPRGIRVNTVAPGLTETEPDAGLPPRCWRASWA